MVVHDSRDRAAKSRAPQGLVEVAVPTPVMVRVEIKVTHETDSGGAQLDAVQR
jgi:hypothetical protein